MSDARFFLVVGLPTVLHCFYHVVIVLHAPHPKGVNEINTVFYVGYVALLISKVRRVSLSLLFSHGICKYTDFRVNINNY